MTGVEVAVGFLVAWLVRKAKRVGQRADAEVDQALDAGMDKLHELVVGKLGTDTAVVKLHKEIETTGAASDRTRDRVTAAIEDTVEADPEFGARLDALVAQLQTLSGNQGTTVGGNVTISADHGSAAAWQMGDVSIGGASNGGGAGDPHQPGQPTR